MTALERELAYWRADRDELAAKIQSQLMPDPDEQRRLENIRQRIAELEDEQDVARIAAAVCAKAAEERA